MQQARDFREETEALYRAIVTLKDEDFRRPTQFKGWTIDDVIGHLHFWNYAADLSLCDEQEFAKLLAWVTRRLGAGEGHRGFTTEWLDGLRGCALRERWREFALVMSERFAAADPERRLQWAGPPMKAATSITARQMETWAHGQEIYDLLGVECEHTDRIKNIALLGVKTYGWTFKNRGLEPPGPPPHVRLTAPSGAVWQWNEPDEANLVEGAAVEFCKVVTQTRNVADTSLRVVGPVAEQWMRIAQCFAGPPEDPPPPGTRSVRR